MTTVEVSFLNMYTRGLSHEIVEYADMGLDCGMREIAGPANFQEIAADDALLDVGGPSLGPAASTSDSALPADVLASSTSEESRTIAKAGEGNGLPRDDATINAENAATKIAASHTSENAGSTEGANNLGRTASPPPPGIKTLPTPSKKKGRSRDGLSSKPKLKPQAVEPPPSVAETRRSGRLNTEGA